MNWKSGLVAVVLLACVGAVLRCAGLGRVSHRIGPRRDSSYYSRVVAGLNVQIVAIGEEASGAQVRRADHSWTPDGYPYQGAERRVAMGYMPNAAKSGSPRWVVFELEPSKPATPSATPMPTTKADVFAYLPKNGHPGNDSTENPGVCGPFPVEIWHGLPRDSAGNSLRATPTPATLGFGVESKDPQPVVLGIAQGEFKVIASGPASVSGLAENQTATLASGSWGRIEGTHLPRPWAESKPSPSHRFRLLGGAFPPNVERNAFFYDSSGQVIASCGDGPNNPGYARAFFSRGGGPTDIVRFEVQERPYEFTTFGDVNFVAPQFKSYSGAQGFNHAVDTVAGKVVGVLRSTTVNSWEGSVLYAADGTRWIDPGQDLSPYEYGQFDPWNHPPMDQWSILFEPIEGFLPTTPVKCDVYASDSPGGSNKEKLTSWNEMPFRTPLTMIQVKPTTRPYVRVEMQIGVGTWKQLETIEVTDRMRSAAESGSPGARVLEVFCDDTGSIRIGREEGPLVASKASWDPKVQPIRVIAHLRDGKTADVNFNMSGFGGSPPNESRYHGLEFTRQLNGTHVQSGFKNLDFKDIASFELQVQDLKPPINIPVHSPVN